MSALTDAIRQSCNAIDALPSGLVWPGKRDLLAGTPIDPNRVNFDAPFPYYEIKRGEDDRMHPWANRAPGGLHMCLHDSSGNSIVPPLVSPFALKIGCYGAGIRHLCHYLLDQDINAMLRTDSSVGIIRGFVANEIGQEMGYPRTEQQMLDNIAYILEQIVPWMTGKWIWTMEGPMPAGYTADPNLTNARIGKVNKMIKQYAASNPAIYCLDMNPTFAPGWTDDAPQPLNPAYLEPGDGEGHWNADANVLWATALQSHL